MSEDRKLALYLFAAGVVVAAIAWALPEVLTIGPVAARWIVILGSAIALGLAALAANAAMGRDGGPAPFATPSTPQIGAGSVVSINQQGGQTAHTIVNEAPAPKLELARERQVKNADGTYTTVFMGRVVSPFPPAELVLEAHAPSVVAMDAMLDRVGIQTQGWSGKREGWCFTSIMQPTGDLEIRVVTREMDDVEIRHGFK